MLRFEEAEGRIYRQILMSGPLEALSYTSPGWLVEIIVLFFFFRSDMDGWKASRFYQNEARKAEERHLWILSIFEAPPKRTRL